MILPSSLLFSQWDYFHFWHLHPRVGGGVPRGTWNCLPHPFHPKWCLLLCRTHRFPAHQPLWVSCGHHRWFGTCCHWSSNQCHCSQHLYLVCHSWNLHWYVVVHLCMKHLFTFPDTQAWVSASSTFRQLSPCPCTLRRGVPLPLVLQYVVLVQAPFSWHL